LNLVIVHSHFRPGGVRRVIELAVPHLLGTLNPPITQIVLLAGEAPDDPWLHGFRQRAGSVPVICSIVAVAGYISEQRAKPAVVARRLRVHLENCLNQLVPAGCLVWAHNQGLGRNLLLTRALNQACAQRKIALLLHHHDWWFDNRWPRWPEMRRSGFRTLSAVARTIFPAVPTVRHAAINRAEAKVLQRHLGSAAGWLPNPASLEAEVAPERVRQARKWLERQLGEPAPVWLVPCRLLRRKNLAEALLLTRWLRPEAWLVSTGGVSSAAEQTYAQSLSTAARQAGWRLRLSVLHGANASPSVAELLAASEVILLTSLQEGFGLPYVEAAAAGRPLIARSLANVAPDLTEFGFRLPHCYEELQVDSDLFDWPAEQLRQRRLFQQWLTTLPRPCRKQVAPPPLLTVSRPPRSVPFSRLTLTAQLELLRQPVAESWARCAPLNPFLEKWRGLAAAGKLEATPWPPQADQWLGGPAYAERFASLLRNNPGKVAAAHGERCQQDLLQAKLKPVFLYPILWSSQT